MSSIVHGDQTCSVPGRSIFSNLQLVWAVLDMIDKTNETGILVTLDQEKVFDCMDHEFLMHVTKKVLFVQILICILICKKPRIKVIEGKNTTLSVNNE